MIFICQKSLFLEFLDYLSMCKSNLVIPGALQASDGAGWEKEKGTW